MLAQIALEAQDGIAREPVSDELRRAARGQLAAARLFGQALVRGVRERFKR